MPVSNLGLFGWKLGPIASKKGPHLKLGPINNSGPRLQPPFPCAYAKVPPPSEILDPPLGDQTQGRGGGVGLWASPHGLEGALMVNLKSPNSHKKLRSYIGGGVGLGGPLSGPRGPLSQSTIRSRWTSVRPRGASSHAKGGPCQANGGPLASQGWLIAGHA